MKYLILIAMSFNAFAAEVTLDDIATKRSFKALYAVYFEAVNELAENYNKKRNRSKKQVQKTLAEYSFNIDLKKVPSKLPKAVIDNGVFKIPAEMRNDANCVSPKTMYIYDLK